MIFSIHHIISDEWSMKILEKELLWFLSPGNLHKNLPSLPIQFNDYAHWANAVVRKSHDNYLRSYWHNTLKGIDRRTKVDVDFEKQRFNEHSSFSRSARLADETIAWILAASIKFEATPFIILITLTNLFFSKITGNDDIVLGTLVNGRRNHQLTDVVGYFVNTVILRTVIEQNDSFYSLVCRVKKNFLEAEEHQIYPSRILIKELSPINPLFNNSIFDVMVVYREIDAQKSDYFEDELFVLPQNKFDFAIYLDFGKQLNVRFVANSDLYKTSNIEQLLSNYEIFLEQQTALMKFDGTYLGNEPLELFDSFVSIKNDFE